MLIAFENRNGLKALSWLKPGYRHCYLLYRQGGTWRVVDPISSPFTEHRLKLSHTTRLMAGLAAAGISTARIDIRKQPALKPCLRPFTCVEYIKHILVLRKRRIITPYQLFRHVTHETGLTG